MGIQKQFSDNKNALAWSWLPKYSCDTSRGKNKDND